MGEFQVREEGEGGCGFEGCFDPLSFFSGRWKPDVVRQRGSLRGSSCPLPTEEPRLPATASPKSDSSNAASATFYGHEYGPAPFHAYHRSSPIYDHAPTDGSP